MTNEELIAEANRICREQPQFFMEISALADKTTDAKTKEELYRLETRAYHLQEGRDI